MTSPLASELRESSRSMTALCSSMTCVALFGIPLSTIPQGDPGVTRFPYP